MEEGAVHTDKYRRVREIASGGMGEVVLALRQEKGFQRLYAVKRLLPVHRDDTQLREMFMDEAKVAGLLHHPNVVPVLDVGSDDAGPYLVMEFIDGVSLSRLLRAVTASGELLPLAVVLDILAQAARGLHAAHEMKLPDGRSADLVHRDVSPQNILIGFSGLARVTDFGIAKAIGRETRTSTGILKGKLGYMSPEQLKFKEPDRRSDLFALGVVLYESLTGRRLYPRGNEGARRILEEPAPDVRLARPDVPEKVSRLLASMLSKNVDDRPRTAKVVAETLEEARSQLAPDRAAIGLATFLERHFAAEREAWESDVSERLRRLAAGLSPSVAPASAEAATVPAVEAPTVAALPRPRGGRKPLGAAFLAVSLLIAAAGAVWTYADRSTPLDEPPTSDLLAPLPASPSAPSEAPRPALDVDDGWVPPDTHGLEAGADGTGAPQTQALESSARGEGEGEGEGEETSMAPRRTRARRRARRPSMVPATMDTAPPPTPEEPVPTPMRAGPLDGLTVDSF